MFFQQGVCFWYHSLLQQNLKLLFASNGWGRSQESSSSIIYNLSASNQKFMLSKIERFSILEKLLGYFCLTVLNSILVDFLFLKTKSGCCIKKSTQKCNIKMNWNSSKVSKPCPKQRSSESISRKPDMTASFIINIVLINKAQVCLAVFV